jgi:diaminohydroxyphosphoribosylaminopyrimidine deaminase/5-amino-6-(5-phosphoribosylamino)uracil reductase
VQKNALEARGASGGHAARREWQGGPSMMPDLGQREINELHVEAGSKLNGSLIRAGLVDEFLLYLAPKLLGPGQGHGGARSLQSLADAVALLFIAQK